jgi:MerR family mercuric resistance operon transcriptional regulator
MPLLTIGKLAEQVSVNKETIRYYQRRGLISEPKKPAQGYRLYNEEHVNRIQFVRRAQELGFTLDEVAQLIDLGKHDCRKTQRLAESKLDTTQEKIKDLRKLEKGLKQLVQGCETNSNKAKCPLVQSLKLA